MSGIYIHIPFCKQACSYCDFHFSTTFQPYRTDLISAMVTELESTVSYLNQDRIESIYFGGGTPSLLTGEEIENLLTTIKKLHAVSPNAEITLEANPDDITKEKLQAWKLLGINRLSIGVQSFLPRDLKWMNRAHSPEEAKESIRIAKKLDFQLTLDLMYGLPDASSEEWSENIQQAISFEPEHISAYCLTIEDKTALAKWVQENKIKPPSENIQADQFNLLLEKLTQTGYEQYEISNFAKNGKYAIHNSNYWKGASYLGIGPSAHSFNGTQRSWNIANNQQYIRGIQQKKNMKTKEELSLKDRFNEKVMTGLRTKWGVDLTELNQLQPIEQSMKNNIVELTEKKLIFIEKDTLYLTQPGKLLADQIAASLFVT